MESISVHDLSEEENEKKQRHWKKFVESIRFQSVELEYTDKNGHVYTITDDFDSIEEMKQAYAYILNH